jgi:DNA-directed RNA polymerase subunit RPC12/RpoP
MPEAHFACPNCEKSIPLDLTTDDLFCPHCGGKYQLVHLGGEVGWKPVKDGPLWQTQRIHPLYRRVKFSKQGDSTHNPGLGRARARRLKRQQHKSRLTFVRTGFLALGMIAALWLITSFAPQISGIVLAADLVPDTWEPSPFTPTNTASPTRTTYPTHTPTTTPTPLPTQTPTPLPQSLLTATAWQTTLDQAIVNSHAMQTQNVLKEAATQTALPPLLTAMAEDRISNATQTAAAQSAGR